VRQFGQQRIQPYPALSGPAAIQADAGGRRPQARGTT
jgi:hypothetical protein